MVLITDICDAVAAELATLYEVGAESTLAPFSSSVLVSVSPVSQTVEAETRDSSRVATVVQAVFRTENASELKSIIATTSAVKRDFPGKVFKFNNTAVYCDGVDSVGTTALTSAEVVGGVYDSGDYRAAAVVQVPLVVHFIHYEGR